MGRIFRMPEVEKEVKLKRSSIYDLISKGKFPKPIKLSARSSGWLQSEIDDWIDKRVSERDQVA